MCWVGGGRQHLLQCKKLLSARKREGWVVLTERRTRNYDTGSSKMRAQICQPQNKVCLLVPAAAKPLSWATTSPWPSATVPAAHKL